MASESSPTIGPRLPTEVKRREAQQPSAEEYFNRAARHYVKEDKLAALKTLDLGLHEYPGDARMLKLHAAWFHDRHFGTVVGFAILLGNIGAVLATAPLAALLRFVSWRDVFVLIGALSIVIAVLSWIFVRDDPVLDLEGVSRRVHAVHFIGRTSVVGMNESAYRISRRDDFPRNKVQKVVYSIGPDRFLGGDIQPVETSFNLPFQKMQRVNRQ